MLLSVIVKLSICGFAVLTSLNLTLMTWNGRLSARSDYFNLYWFYVRTLLSISYMGHSAYLILCLFNF